ncbi:MAG: hypothetical protein J7599_24265 [Niabella sp.]|nr:hypothetical protein [Niabella sp.]
MLLLRTLFLSLTTGITLNAMSQQERLVLPLPVNKVLQSGDQKNNSLLQGRGITDTKFFEVVDLTGDTAILGYLPTEKFKNDRMAIATPVPKQDWIYDIVDEGMIKNFGIRGVSAMYVIHDISVGRVSEGNYVRIKGRLYESPVGMNQYKPVKTIDEFALEGNSDISMVSGLVRQAITSSVTTATGGVNQGGVQKLLRREEVISSEKDNYLFISKRVFRNGIYISFDDFKQGTPQFDNFYVKTDTAARKTTVYSFTKRDSTMVPVTPWGVIAGGELYLYKDGILYPCEAIGNNLVISKYIDPARRKNHGRFWRSNIGERFNELEDANPFDNKYVISINNYRQTKAKGEAIKINADTGELEL